MLQPRPTHVDTPLNVQRDYQWCRNIARSHYENFPVASYLLPARFRNPVSAIYAFARKADDIADEGDAAQQTRLQQLDDMAAALDAIETGVTPGEPMYRALADSIARHALPIDLFRDLLDAFRQDVTKSRYASFGELMDYCKRSANPVGRLLLHLTDQASPRNLALSDALCSALQLINFIQDIEQDFVENNRIYIPMDEMQRFNVSEDDIRELNNSIRVRQLLRFQIQRASRLLDSGSPLAKVLKGRFALELRTIILGGSRILEKLHDQQNLFSRPRLDTMDRLSIAWGAFIQGFKSSPHHYRI